MSEIIDYIPYLRKKIGHDKCLSVGLTAMVFNQKGEVLIERRKDNGKYCFPGGSIDLNETVLEGLKREIKEETGIEIKNISLFSIRSGEKCDFYYPNGDITQYVDLNFLAEADGRIEIKAQASETTEVYFCPFDRLPSRAQFTPGSSSMIEKYLKKDFRITID